MPVLDHPVHESTILDATKKKHCFNRPDFNPFYYAPDGLSEVVSPDRIEWVAGIRLRKIPFRMTHTCMYDGAPGDPTCQGCKRINEGVEYAKTQQPKA